jgi:hypothetical protein
MGSPGPPSFSHLGTCFRVPGSSRGLRRIAQGETAKWRGSFGVLQPNSTLRGYQAEVYAFAFSKTMPWRSPTKPTFKQDLGTGCWCAWNVALTQATARCGISTLLESISTTLNCLPSFCAWGTIMDLKDIPLTTIIHTKSLVEVREYHQGLTFRPSGLELASPGLRI